MLEILGYILLAVGIGCLGHSYVLYPVLMYFLGRGDQTWPIPEPGNEPRVWILMSAFNEEAVIEEKLKSFDALRYPEEKLEFWIGSDGSTDRTDSMIKGFSSERIRFFRFEDRAGKANVINRLMTELRKREGFSPQSDILILTDANVLFTENLVSEIVKPFEDQDIGQVGAVIENYGEDKSGISYQEKFYIGSENRLKIYEGNAWGTMMGAFGACYAIRASLFPELRKTFLMEDFYISMNVLSQGFKAVMSEKARCLEDLPSEVEEEFKRKTRISAGNFQNLSVYYNLLWPPSALAFSFMSHKVLRWLGPVWLFFMLAGLVMLSLSDDLGWVYGLIVMVLLGLSPLIDRAFKLIGWNLTLLRYPAYFMEMNLALLNGFFLYLNGVRSNAWQPTKRNR